MDVRRITNKAEWDTLSKPEGRDEFLQSWDYGDFLSRAGREVWRIAVGDVRLQAIAHCRRFSMDSLYVARADLTEQQLAALLAFVKQQGFIFLQLELTHDPSTGSFQSIKTKNIQAQHRWILDVSPD